MKRLGSSDSLGVFMPICPTTEEHSPKNSHVYNREFQSMLESLDEEVCLEESGQVAEKKRRLSVDQVKALEKNFEVENKLEPERKVTLAQEIGLQPRQVAVWFQNRRARWKTKQLERDYSLLKSNYDSLKRNFDSLQRDNETLLNEVRELKPKLNEDNRVVNSGSENKVVEIKQEASNPGVAKCEFVEMNFTGGHGGSSLVDDSIMPDCKDGSSDSDSSATFNEGNSPTAAISSPGNEILDHNTDTNGFIISSPGSSSMDCFQFPDSKAIILEDTERVYQPQFVKIEEYNFFGGPEEPCNFFDDQAATLHWYCPDQWT